MCRPAKRPKPLAAVQPLPLKMEEQNSAEPMYENMKESTDAFMSLSDFMESNAGVIFDSWSATPSAPAMVDMESRPKTFVYVTYDMVTAPENYAAVGFSQDGLSIEIRDTDLLSEKVLPKYFRHKNVTSFYRQLNSYGFRTTRSASADIAHTFAHELFRMGRPDLLHSIVRKKCVPKDKLKDKTKKPSSPGAESTDAASSSNVSSPASDFDSHSVESSRNVDNQHVMKMIEELRQSQQQAQERALALEAHNRRMAEENRAILQESEQIFRTMNKLVENQTAAIGKLFGPEASKAFAEQAKPYRVDVEPIEATVTRKHNHAQEFTSEPNDFVFEDEDLELLENIFVPNDIWDNAPMIA